MSRMNEVPVSRVDELEFYLLARLPASNFDEPTGYTATDRARIPLPRVEKTSLQFELHSASKNGPVGGNVIVINFASKICRICRFVNPASFSLLEVASPVPGVAT
jgi:hypothetical protein